jgi:putative ABC transport system permease protein
MISNYLKTTLRSITKRKVYSLINISGLAIGIAVFILIALYIRYEFSFDRFNENYHRICRVEKEVTLSGGKQKQTKTPFPLAPILVDNFPEVVDAVRLTFTSGHFSSHQVQMSFEKHGLYADPSFFDIFTFHLIKGNPKDALRQPFSIVLTEELAEKYFPGEEPIGKILKFEDEFDLKVTGVMENPPANSHFKSRYIISFPTFKDINLYNPIGDWNSDFSFTYILLQNNNSSETLNQKISPLLFNYIKNNKSTLYLKPLKDIHFSLLVNELGANTDITIIYLYIALAVFILAIACINFMNLSTAYSSVRAKEIGIRKAVGSTRLALIQQFLSESVFLAVISLFIAFILAILFLPVFGDIVHRELGLNLFRDWLFILGMLVMGILVGLIAGSYPAFFLSSLRPARILKRNIVEKSKSPFSRKFLVGFQFLISLVLIIATMVIYRQLNYVKERDYGFEKDNILMATFKSKVPEQLSQYEVLKSELLKHPDILNAAVSNNRIFNNAPDIHINWEGASQGEKMRIYYNVVDYDFLGTFGLEIKEGRKFSRSFSTDRKKACILNETAVRKFGWKSPLGKKIYNNRFTVVGVIKDFHVFSAFYEIPPYMLMMLSEELTGYRTVSIRISPRHVSETKRFIEEKFQAFFPRNIVDFKLLSEGFDKIFYETVEGVGKTFGFFSFLTIFIAMIGLLGLVSYSAQRRTKEIGIRKVLGASIANIFYLLSREFLKLQLIANLIAWPLAYFILNQILQQFAYRIDIGLWIFILAGIATLVISLVTVSAQILKAALANPISALRYE